MRQQYGLHPVLRRLQLFFWIQNVTRDFFLGSLAANLTNFTSSLDIFIDKALNFVDISLCIATGATIESFTVAFIIKKLIGYPNSLSHWKDILILFIIAGMVGSIPSPTIGVTSLYLKGIIPFGSYFIIGGLGG